MNVENCLKRADELFGQTVELDGFLVLTFDGGYLVESIDQRDEHEMAIELDVPNLKKVLMAQVPPSGGSRYFYLDKARVRGTLARSSSKEFVVCIQSLNELVVEKSGMSFNVI